MENPSMPLRWMVATFFAALGGIGVPFSLYQFTHPYEVLAIPVASFVIAGIVAILIQAIFPRVEKSLAAKPRCYHIAQTLGQLTVVYWVGFSIIAIFTTLSLGAWVFVVLLNVYTYTLFLWVALLWLVTLFTF